MLVNVVVGQFPVTLSLAENLRQIQQVVEQCEPDDLVVFPEGSLSGYSDDIRFLDQINPRAVEQHLDSLHQLVVAHRIHLFVGVCRPDDLGWRNQAVYLGPQGEVEIYNKVNLAWHERGHMVPGDRLPVLNLKTHWGVLRVGVQLCREIRYPGQWHALARSGAEVFVYMTHTIDNGANRPVWRSHLVSRAAENQRFVVAANTAHEASGCPSGIIHPSGSVLAEAPPNDSIMLRHVLNTEAVSNWYLSQTRQNLPRQNPCVDSPP